MTDQRPDQGAERSSRSQGRPIDKSFLDADRADDSRGAQARNAAWERDARRRGKQAAKPPSKKTARRSSKATAKDTPNTPEAAAPRGARPPELTVRSRSVETWTVRPSPSGSVRRFDPRRLPSAPLAQGGPPAQFSDTPSDAWIASYARTDWFGASGRWTETFVGAPEPAQRADDRAAETAKPAGDAPAAAAPSERAVAEALAAAADALDAEEAPKAETAAGAQAAKAAAAERSAPIRRPGPVDASSGSDRASDGGAASGGSGGSGDGKPPATSPLDRGAPKRIFGRRDDDFRAVFAKANRDMRRSLVSVGIFSFVLNLLILAIPIYLFQVSDRVLTSRSTETLVMLTVIVVGALAMYAILDVIRRFALMRIATRFETEVAAATLSSASRAAQQGSAREFTALNDLANVRNFLTGPTLLAMFDAPVAPIYFLAVFLIHPQLGMIVVVAALLLMIVALVNQRATAVPFARANAFGQRANFQAEAMARGGEVVNAMGMIREGVLLWGREAVESLKAQVIAQDRNTVFAGVSKFIRLSTQVAMLCWGAYLALGAELTGGMMIAASIIASRALSPVEGLIEGWRSFVQARGAFARVKALLSQSPLNLERLRLPRPQGRLHVERVLYVPPPTKKVILNGVNFRLEPGEVMAIVGPSGTGKSTLAKMLVGSITPTSGAVRLDLMDIRNWDPRQFGETVGYLPQEVQLFPGAIKHNISRLREDANDVDIFDAAELAGVHEMISQLPQGYETIIGLDGSPLSGGQKQRVGLARAFYGSPRLVVLDEPNSNLDSEGEAALAAALSEARRRGITVVAVTQRPSLLRSVDKILVMNEGRVQALGPREDVLPLLRKGSESGPQVAGPTIEAAE